MAPVAASVLVFTSKAPVTTSVAPVTASVLVSAVRHLQGSSLSIGFIMTTGGCPSRLPPDSTRAVYLRIESWLPGQEEEQNNILVLTTRKNSAQSLRSFCHQSRRSTKVETAVKVAGATAKHCITLYGHSSFLSDHSKQTQDP